MTKKADISLLQKESPGLYGKIFRTFGSVPEICKMAYSLAARHGGNNEIWFLREEGASYNPRAARIAVVLLEGESRISIRHLALAMLSSLLIYPDSDSRIKISDEDLCQNFLNMHTEYNTRILASSEEDPEFANIYISLFIDKMRHVHISKENRAELIRNTLTEAEYYRMLSEKYFPYYEPFIAHWIKRFSNHESVNISNG